MMSIQVGSAPDSWGVWFGRDERQTPWNRFLDEIAEAGYEWTELGPLGYLPTEPRALRSELDRRGLKVSGSFVMAHFEDADAWPETEKQARAMGELLASVGAQYVVLIDDVYTDLFTGKSLRPATLNDAEWGRFVETVHRLAELARRDYGLKAVFHPHAETHVEYENQIERLIRDTEPGLVSICLDTGHHAYRGGDPVRFTRDYKDRVTYLHLKSVDADMQKRVAEENIPFALAVAQDMFVEPSAGMVDFPAFRDMLRDIGYAGFAIVEQDMYPAPFDKPLPIAKRTRAYLREIGIG
jgi:inosose dehydratase